jgi:hypothetical protein
LCPGRDAACNAASQSRDPPTRMDPGPAAHHAEGGVLRSIRGTWLQPELVTADCAEADERGFAVRAMAC